MSTWYSVPVGKSSRVFLAGAAGINWPRTNRLYIQREATVSSRTIFLSRLIGLYCIVIALSMMTRRQATAETVTALLQNPSMMLIVGIITLAAGLAVVLAHNIWSGVRSWLWSRSSVG
jgi:putative exporter of polyketide antibiotics